MQKARWWPVTRLRPGELRPRRPGRNKTGIAGCGRLEYNVSAPVLFYVSHGLSLQRLAIRRT
jgi:hypothetical protein